MNLAISRENRATEGTASLPVFRSVFAEFQPEFTTLQHGVTTRSPWLKVTSITTILYGTIGEYVP
jgi:hypothetical protein